MMILVVEDCMDKEILLIEVGDSPIWPVDCEGAPRKTVPDGPDSAAMVSHSALTPPSLLASCGNWMDSLSSKMAPMIFDRRLHLYKISMPLLILC